MSKDKTSPPPTRSVLREVQLDVFGYSVFLEGGQTDRVTTLTPGFGPNIAKSWEAVQVIKTKDGTKTTLAALSPPTLFPKNAVYLPAITRVIESTGTELFTPSSDRQLQLSYTIPKEHRNRYSFYGRVLPLHYTAIVHCLAWPKAPYWFDSTKRPIIDPGFDDQTVSALTRSSEERRKSSEYQDQLLYSASDKMTSIWAELECTPCQHGGRECAVTMVLPDGVQISGSVQLRLVHSNVPSKDMSSWVKVTTDGKVPYWIVTDWRVLQFVIVGTIKGETGAFAYHSNKEGDKEIGDARRVAWGIQEDQVKVSRLRPSAAKRPARDSPAPPAKRRAVAYPREGPEPVLSPPSDPDAPLPAAIAPGILAPSPSDRIGASTAPMKSSALERSPALVQPKVVAPKVSNTVSKPSPSKIPASTSPAKASPSGQTPSATANAQHPTATPRPPSVRREPNHRVPNPTVAPISQSAPTRQSAIAKAEEFLQRGKDGLLGEIQRLESRVADLQGAQDQLARLRDQVGKLQQDNARLRQTVDQDARRMEAFKILGETEDATRRRLELLKSCTILDPHATAESLAPEDGKAKNRLRLETKFTRRCRVSPRHARTGRVHR